MKKDKAITLIALIITIIVLLLIAGISIMFVVGENSILEKAKLAKENTNQADVEEQNRLGSINESIDNYTTRSGSVVLSQEQYDSILSRLDAVENQSGIVESGTSSDGLSKYVKYKNGFKMAWGTTAAAAWTNGTNRSYTLPITFSDTSYTVTVSKRNAPSYWAQIGYIVYPSTTSAFSISSWSYSGTYTVSGQTLQWTAMGY